MINFPAGEIRTTDIPAFPLSVRGEQPVCEVAHEDDREPEVDEEQHVLLLVGERHERQQEHQVRERQNREREDEDLVPGVPQVRLAALRSAFYATATDKEFVAQAQKIGLDIDAGDWREMTDNIEKLYATPAAVVSIAAKLIKDGKL